MCLFYVHLRFFLPIGHHLLTHVLCYYLFLCLSAFSFVFVFISLRSSLTDSIIVKLSIWSFPIIM